MYQYQQIVIELHNINLKHRHTNVTVICVFQLFSWFFVPKERSEGVKSRFVGTFLPFVCIIYGHVLSNFHLAIATKGNYYQQKRFVPVIVWLLM